MVSILRNVTGQSLKLFRLTEMYEKRFHKSISVTDLYSMKDTLDIKEINGSRVVSLHMAPNSECIAQSQVSASNKAFCLVLYMPSLHRFIHSCLQVRAVQISIMERPVHMPSIKRSL